MYVQTTVSIQLAPQIRRVVVARLSGCPWLRGTLWIIKGKYVPKVSVAAWARHGTLNSGWEGGCFLSLRRPPGW